ncbi:unnamed protein product [Microthlaspi erraticum]|uniref:Uncharacterized protein n=1 Tax=Microthlaspi erraticum TaxID=1685480 RepID=A0A6D2JTF2_9BRAS|nr:unnamed protein product [Microthlaspi erraticum]
MWWWCSSAKGRSNLERVLLGVTPKPPSFSLPREQGKEEIEYFRLGDLWNCYNEQSAYGLGTQVDLNNGENVMQYYAPYLSTIQIYTHKPTALISRNQNEAGESESSDCWSDSESEKLLSRSMSNDSKTWDEASEDSVFDSDGSPSLRDRLGVLDFKYVERDPPFKRVPLIAKINQLAEKYPALMTLRSVDMSPASWMAVSWYPIYTIPPSRTENDLTTAFLTYHTLSSSFQDNAVVEGKEEGAEWFEESYVMSKRIPLLPFGLATYKMQGDLWGKTGFDQDRLFYLQRAADSWLKQLNADHHDFNFFMNSNQSSPPLAYYPSPKP